MELATVIGLLHDVYLYRTGFTTWHSHNGAEMVRVAFKNSLTGLFSENEQTIIKSAIHHHSDKNHIHDCYDELLKDSDVFQHLPFDTTYGWIYGQRLIDVMNELSLSSPKITVLPKENTAINHFNQSHVGEIAETLAAKKIEGIKSIRII